MLKLKTLSNAFYVVLSSPDNKYNHSIINNEIYTNGI